MEIDRGFLKSRRVNLDNDERIRLARMLQLRMLGEVGKVCRLRPDGIVFHGGTNICTTYGSARWSEDLDFMALPETVEQVFAARAAMEKGIRLWTSLARPGSQVELQGRTAGQDPDPGQVERLQIRWENPDRIGAIRIKVEFFVARPEALSPYRRSVITPRILSQTAGVGLPCADPVAVWADKIVAMALRPVLKHRDIHDLGYMRKHMRYDLFSVEERLAALRVSAGIYGRNMPEILEGLSRREISEGIRDLASFTADMRRWFPAEVFANMREIGMIERLHADFLEEFGIGHRLVREAARPGSLKAASGCPGALCHETGHHETGDRDSGHQTGHHEAGHHEAGHHEAGHDATGQDGPLSPQW